MATTFDKMIERLPDERRAKIEARVTQLIAEEMTLRDVRKARKLTQERMAELLGIGQDSVSRLEKRSDLLLSTLASYIEAMGGKLRLIAEFRDRPPVALSGLLELREEKGPPGKGKTRRVRKEKASHSRV